MHRNKQALVNRSVDETTRASCQTSAITLTDRQGWGIKGAFSKTTKYISVDLHTDRRLKQSMADVTDCVWQTLFLCLFT